MGPSETVYHRLIDSCTFFRRTNQDLSFKKWFYCLPSILFHAYIVMHSRSDLLTCINGQTFHCIVLYCIVNLSNNDGQRQGQMSAANKLSEKNEKKIVNRQILLDMYRNNAMHRRLQFANKKILLNWNPDLRSHRPLCSWCYLFTLSISCLQLFFPV